MTVFSITIEVVVCPWGSCAFVGTRRAQAQGAPGCAKKRYATHRRRLRGHVARSHDLTPPTPHGFNLLR
jgi:hypothetical protein